MSSGRAAVYKYCSGGRKQPRHPQDPIQSAGGAADYGGRCDHAYYAFAGVLLTLFGIRALVLPVVIMCLCYGISVGLQKCGSRNGNGLHLLALAPMIFVFILPGTTLYQCVALAPGVLYVLYMALSKNNALSWYRQVNIFSLFCKVYIIFSAFVSMVGG